MPRRKGPRAVVKTGARRRRRFGRVARLARGGVGGAVASLQGYRAELAGQCSELTAQIQAVDAALRAMGIAVAARRGPGRPAGRPVGRPAGAGVRRKGRGRGPRAGSLKEHILKVLTGRGIMSVKDITAGVLAGGYSTSNQTLAKSVGIALTELPNVRKVARGQFRLK